MLSTPHHASPPPLAPVVHTTLLLPICHSCVYAFITPYGSGWEETYTFVFLGLA